MNPGPKALKLCQLNSDGKIKGDHYRRSEKWESSGKRTFIQHENLQHLDTENTTQQQFSM